MRRDRAERIQKLANAEFDVLIIGGGASGTGAALDAALRGLKVALVEAEDFASGASGASTKLVHGGVRYLEKAVKELDYGQYKLVREALHERAGMIRNAPHLAYPSALILPTKSRFERFYFYIGLKMYDWMAGSRNLAPCRSLSKAETYERLPALKKGAATGGVLYSDGQFYDSEYAVALARTAEQAGAVVLNHAACEVVHKNAAGQIESVEVSDRLNGKTITIRVKTFLNCTGAASDRVRQMFRPNEKPRLRPSKGIHVVAPLETAPIKNGLLIPETADGRVIFVLPWQNQLLIGTTDTETRDPQAPPMADRDEVDYLLKYVNEYLEKPLTRDRVRSVWAGNRPLVQKLGESKTEALIRNHEVEIWEKEMAVNLLGGKWTTYRQMAEEAIDAIETLLKRPQTPCKTADYPLVGSPEKMGKDGLPQNLPDDIRRHLQKYGSETPKIGELLAELGMVRLAENHPHTTAEATFAFRFGMAETLFDILDRRLRLGYIDLKAAEAAAETVGQIAEKELGWTPLEKAFAVAQYQQAAREREAAIAEN